MDIAASRLERMTIPTMTLMFGVVIGIAIRYPSGWNLPSDTAALFGAFAGSIFTIAGAIAVWKFQERSTAERIAGAIKRNFDYIFIATLCAIDDFDIDAPTLDSDSVYDVRKKALDELVRSVQGARNRLPIFSNGVHQLDPTKMESFLDLDGALAELERRFIRRRDHFRQFARSFSVKPELEELRTEVMPLRLLLNDLDPEISPRMRQVFEGLSKPIYAEDF